MESAPLALCRDTWKDDGAIESLGSPRGMDGDVKNSQALLNHKLLKAAQDGDLARLQRALALGAYIETRRPFVVTPESAAVASDATLQTRGAGLTPLMYAAQGGYSEACELLICRGACVNSEDEDGMRPLHFAATSGSAETCATLLSGGSELNALDDDGHRAMDHIPKSLLSSQAAVRYWKAVFDTPAAKGGVPSGLPRMSLVPVYPSLPEGAEATRAGAGQAAPGEP